MDSDAIVDFEMARYADDRVTELPDEQLSVAPTLTDDVYLAFHH